MNPIVKNILAVIVGILAGSVVNMAIITVGPMILPPPAGVDLSTMEGIRKSMPLFKPINFLVPFSAHALGTLTGAFVAVKLAASHRMKCAIGIGVFFLIGGIAAATMLGGPLWFTACDLILAYIPMSLLGGFLAGGQKQRNV
jgi:hypothetical protein